MNIEIFPVEKEYLRTINENPGEKVQHSCPQTKYFKLRLKISSDWTEVHCESKPTNLKNRERKGIPVKEDIFLG